MMLAMTGLQDKAERPGVTDEYKFQNIQNIQNIHAAGRPENGFERTSQLYVPQQIPAEMLSVVKGRKNNNK
jgi:hypothetical protein